MNGVELLEIIHDKYPDIITFVVSGYDDFQYVKDTFMAESINYLVKPITRIDLVNALSRALEIISTRKLMPGPGGAADPAVKSSLPFTGQGVQPAS